eukprot:m.310316 g.310316  ORF g.310316 m.310316 type:complete len:200 (+) comp50865_c0_seq1:114-713(+)
MNRDDGSTHLKVIVLGSPQSGKTSFVERFCFDSFGGFRSVGEAASKAIKLRGKKFTVQLWDTHKNLLPGPGHTGPPGIPKGAHGAVAVYDITDKNSLYNVAKKIEEFQSSAQPDAQVMLVGNKFDLAPEKRQVHVSDASVLVKHYDLIGILETSAKNNKGVDEAVELLIDAIHSSVLWESMQGSIELVETAAVKEGCCS